MANLGDFLRDMDVSGVKCDKECDELLLEICKAFVDEKDASDLVNDDCLIEPYKKHGIGKQLKIDPYDSKFDQEEDDDIGGQEVNDDEVDHLLIEQPQRKHGNGKVLKVLRDAYERAENDGNSKIDGQKNVKPLKEQDLQSKLEASKLKLRENYQKTLPTRHVKVLDMKDRPDLKRPSTCLKKSVPRQCTTQSTRARAPKRRSLAGEARRIFKKMKTECTNRMIAI